MKKYVALLFFVIASLLLMPSNLLGKGDGNIPLKNWEKFYQKQVNYHRLIVEIDQQLGTEEKKQLLNGIKEIKGNAHVHIPYTPYTIVRLNSIGKGAYKDAIAALNREVAVLAVTPFLLAENGHQRGVLPQVHVKLKQAKDLALLEQLAAEINLVKITPQRYLKQVYQLQVNKHTLYNALDLAISLAQCGLFEYAEPNYLLHPVLCSANDPLYDKQWSLENLGTVEQGSGVIGADINIADAWFYTKGSPNIKVAVIDSGVDTNHVEFAGRLLPGFDALDDQMGGYPFFSPPEDAHGTACAGIIGAAADNEIGLAGIAPECQLIPIRVYHFLDTLELPGIGQIPYSTSEWMANCFSWAWQEADADVLSNSWGLPGTLLGILPGGTAMANEAMIEAAANGRGGKGLPMLFSSGNDGGTPIWPSYKDYCIAVNATSMCDERKYPNSCDGEDWEGNWGTGLMVSAPGVSVPATDILATNGYNASDYTLSFNGTSAACPHAAAIVALMYAVNPDLSLEQVRSILGSSSDKVGGYNYDSIGVYGPWSAELGYGRVNAGNAVTQALITTGVDNNPNFTNNDLQVYPNPISQEQTLTVRYYLAAASKVTITLYNLKGSAIYNYQSEIKQAPGWQMQQLINKEILPAGTYILQVGSANKRNTQKVICL